MPRMSCSRLCCLMMLAIFSGAVSAEAQNKAQAVPKLVANDESQVDFDYWIQGEYMGYVAEQAGSAYVKRLGLQVVARGAGNFDVVLFPGGLPGDGWNQQDRIVEKGQLEDQQLSVQINQYQLTIGNNQALVRDQRGNELGRLPKLARYSPTLGKQAPENALVLFNGEVNDLWKNMKVTADGLLQEGCETVNEFGDFHLHVEFQLPYKPEGVGQDRGNSGVYLQRRYEIQVLDSFGEPGLPNQCGGIYTLIAPDQNMCLAPLAWQTYDIDFRAARFDDEGNKTENMKIRVLHNGVVIHDAIEVEQKTGAGKPEGPELMPILLQDHKNPVRYRNIWLVAGDPFAKEAEESTAKTTQPAATAHPPVGFVAGPYHSRRSRYPANDRWPELHWHDFRTPYHNYGYDPTQPLPYWFSPSFVDLPAYPYYGFQR